MVAPERIVEMPYGVLHEYDLVGTRIRLFSVNPNSRAGPFFGHKALAAMIMSGSCMKTSRSETRILSTGSVAAMKGCDSVTDIVAREHGVTWLHFELNEEHQLRIANATDGCQAVVRSTSPSLVYSAVQLVRLLKLAHDDCQWDGQLEIDGFVSELIRQSHRPVQDHRAANKLQELILEHFSRSLEVRSVSRELGCNPSHLGRSFKTLYGCSPGEYLRRVRFRAALPQLESGETILKIACDCGFADESHFCRVFKQYSGYTPSEWRRLCKPPMAGRLNRLSN